MMRSQQTARASGYSARLLEAARLAVEKADGCPCGKQVIAWLASLPAMKGKTITLCRNGWDRDWLQILLAHRIVTPIADAGHKAVRVEIETPLWMAIARLKREKREKES